MAKKAKGISSENKILEAAFVSIAKHGLHKTTFQTISEISSFSQASIVKVFKNKNNIFPIVANYIWKDALEETSHYLESQRPKNEKESIKAYADQSINYFLKKEYLPDFYMNFYYMGMYNEEIRTLNLQIKGRAIERLGGILFSKNKKSERESKAQYIHNLMTGLLLNYCIEKNKAKLKKYRDQWIQTALSL